MTMMMMMKVSVYLFGYYFCCCYCLLALTITPPLAVDAAPNANEQCQILYKNSDASFCQNYTHNICKKLVCRGSVTDLNCNTATTFAAADGTPCKVGHICQEGKCVMAADQADLQNDCVYGDDILLNETIISVPLPASAMLCSDFMAYAVSIGQDPFAYCENSTFREVCCQTCKIYDKFPCRDVSATDCQLAQTLCNSTTATLGSLPINISCPFTCDACPLKDKQFTCAHNLCQNGGVCIRTAATNNLLFGFYCACPVGYLGQFCELKYPCDPNPCQNEGNCSVTGPLTYQCQCKPGYFGPNCGMVSLDISMNGVGNPCYPNPCSNGGICSLAYNVLSYTCTCPPLYTGSCCDKFLSPCSNSPCQNNGGCNANYNQWPYYQCNCNSGYSGPNCQSAGQFTSSQSPPYDPCQSNPCINGGICLRTGLSSYTCQCPPLYTGSCCDEQLNPCEPHPCSNPNDVCNRHPDNWPYYKCHQNHNQQPPPPPPSNYNNRDNDHYLIPSNNNNNPCYPNPCSNNGQCTQTGSYSYVCTCAPCYSGNCCQRFNNPCSPCPCANGGICVPQVNPSQCTYQCVCPPGFYGPTCLIPATMAMTTTVTIDPCQPNPCANGGQCCRTGQYGYVCKCPSCYSGPCCQVYNDPCTMNSCPQMATCVRQISPYQCSFRCECPPNTIPPFCIPTTTTTTTTTTTRDPCQPNPCANGGLCYRKGQYGYQCQCSSCYTGPCCQVYNDPCSPSPCPGMATCVRQISPFQCSYRCECPPNTIPPFCIPTTTTTTTTTTTRDPCQPNPCANGGQCCRTGLYSYVCKCPPCYSGSCCQVYNDPCSTNPCPQLATCVRQISPYQCGYRCECPPNTIPPFCIPITTTTPYDPCRINPCQNGGSCCRTGQSSYECQCRSCYSGSLCQTYTDPCASCPCSNGGTCVPVVNAYQCSYQCLCPPGCYGKYCENYPPVIRPPLPPNDPCNPNPCQNGGICLPHGDGDRYDSSSSSSYRCKCSNNCYGSTCQYTYPQPLPGPPPGPPGPYQPPSCQPNPCRNGGRCQPVPPGYTDLSYLCMCSNNFYQGSLCDRFQLNAPQCADRDGQFCYWIKLRGYCNNIYSSYCPMSCGGCQQQSSLIKK